MDQPRNHQNHVSLRGASSKEISRDALLQNISQERELRSYAKRAAKAALFIQRVWRRNYTMKMVALKLQEEWEILVNHRAARMTRTWISRCFLRPFLFFITHLSMRDQKIQTKNIECIRICLKILFNSIKSTDLEKNFCCLAMGTIEERKIWIYQTRKIVCLCSSILAQCHSSPEVNQDILSVASLGIRLVLVIIDLKEWKSVANEDLQEADKAVKDLVCFIGSRRSGLYCCLRKYIKKLGICYSSNWGSVSPPNDAFLVTVSAVTLALRPFHVAVVDAYNPVSLDLRCAAEQYSVFILTIPWLSLRLPAVLLPALKHKSILSPCFKVLMMLKEKMLMEMSSLDQVTVPFDFKDMPPIGWALANTICLATISDNKISDSRQFTDGLDLALYVHAIIIYSENFTSWLDNIGQIRKESQEHQFSVKASLPFDMHENETSLRSLNMSYMDRFLPCCQQWHLTKLLATLEKDASIHEADGAPMDPNQGVKLKLLDIAYFYSFMLRIFSALNPTAGSLLVLNMLSFTPGFLVNLWEALECSLFPENVHVGKVNICASKLMKNKNSRVYGKDKKKATKDGSNMWLSVIHKITGKSHVDAGSMDLNFEKVGEDSCDVWDIKLFRRGAQEISKDISCLLHLFCATYSHLLLVLDDIEFYEKQVPFTLEQQQKIASVLNTLVYNDLSHGVGSQNKSLMDAAVRCLHLLYERDCRHKFCPPDLWLSPARKGRPPIAVAARTHEALHANLMLDEAASIPRMGSVISTIPHVFPFEERVEMFREFIKKDKLSRIMAGEVAGPGRGTAKIVVRRGHIVEDGFQQLNSLGSRLKSSIHVSFVSECGLPEAGLDYGGLTKEFLTDITKAAFAPEYGLFSQTASSDRLMIPNTSARFIENGIQMIEFLGRVVGKALYEGILLDYSFSQVFVQKLLGRYSFIDELSTLDPELYKNLMFVKHFDGDVKDLSLDFTITEESYGECHVIDLQPGGKDILVTDENKLQYVHAIADYKLNRQLLSFSNAFFRGLTDLISPSWLKLFNASEFNQLLSGGNLDIDIDDLRSNTRYTGGYSEGSRTVKLFWEVIAEFEPKERCMLLKFVTCCSRGPLLGFKHLLPEFTIHKVACGMPLWATLGGPDVDRLPSASTCYNTLKLPTYKRSSTLREKLLYAINSNTGFELS